MTKKLFSALLAAVLLLALTACAPETPISDNYPTLPSFPQEQTPLQQLQTALSAAAAAGERTVRYGTVRKDGNKTEETAYTQSLSGDRSFDRDALYAAVKDFPDNENFLQDFCNRSIRAIPSNTGIIRYELSGLTAEDATKLLYTQPRDDLSQGNCTVSVEIDAAGRFSGLEVIWEVDETALRVFCTVTFSDSP